MNLQNILDKWNIGCEIEAILERWREPHRKYHGISHLEDLLSQIERRRSEFSEEEFEMLSIAALFHDAIYDPTSSMNEEESAQLLLGFSDGRKEVMDICQMIMETKSHMGSSQISEKFCQMDMDIVNRNLDDLLAWEEGIRYEYSIFPKEEYKSGRIKFLEYIASNHQENRENIDALIEAVRTY